MYIWILVIAVVILYILTQVSSTAKYHIKYIGYLLYCIFLTSLCGVFCIFRPGSSKNIFIAQFILKVIKFEWLFGLDIQIEDWDNLLNAKKPFVVVSNHQTAIDALVLLKASPNGTAPLAKKVLLYVPIFGPVCWLCGTIFINRKKGKSAIDIMKKVGREMKEKMTSVWIFPEGTRYQLDKVMAFKKGAFHLAVQAKVPIVPVLIGNYRNVIDHKNKQFDGGVIRVKCLPPVHTDNVDNVDTLVEEVQQLLSNEFEKDLEKRSSIFENIQPIKRD
ncbi:1-acyl-sn-glycerol-3-phosphate acyltransferase alpha-like [Hydractinia symbiolongicarpus]|uniref:1-acyl-sn-glycerol-3-phosphate acyltransferase alpha-like n=1 Tax=Hydractinia symbiolongicarpus TaxID=13093 RepID=UPI00254B32B0|nr:1-acyl-sn-glycerol-3-phosphate acyltransferase alpha-like [Hydractinia symbiolongicarpus]